MIVRILGLLVGGLLVWAGCVGAFDPSADVDAIGSMAMGAAFVAYGVVGQHGLERFFPAYAEKNRRKKERASESASAPEAVASRPAPRT